MTELSLQHIDQTVCHRCYFNAWVKYSNCQHKVPSSKAAVSSSSSSFSFVFHNGLSRDFSITWDVRASVPKPKAHIYKLLNSLETAVARRPTSRVHNFGSFEDPRSIFNAKRRITWASRLKTADNGGGASYLTRYNPRIPGEVLFLFFFFSFFLAFIARERHRSESIRKTHVVARSSARWPL